MNDAATPANAWQSWFAASDGHNGWRVIRFEVVDAEGKPVGKPIASVSPANQVRIFGGEASANRAAAWLNIEEGR